MDAKTSGSPLNCPVNPAVRSLLGRTNRDWWPDSLPLDVLHQSGGSADPMGDDFDYAQAFNALDYAALKADLTALMTDSKSFWPADYGHYGPFFIRMAWQRRATYRRRPRRGSPAHNVLRHSIAGPTTATWTRPGACLPISRSTQESAGRLFILPALSRRIVAAQCSVSAAAARTCSRPTRHLWGAERIGSSRPKNADPADRELESSIRGGDPDGADLRHPKGGRQPRCVASARDIKITFERWR